MYSLKNFLIQVLVFGSLIVGTATYVAVKYNQAIEENKALTEQIKQAKLESCVLSTKQALVNLVFELTGGMVQGFKEEAIVQECNKVLERGTVLFPNPFQIGYPEPDEGN